MWMNCNFELVCLLVLIHITQIFPKNACFFLIFCSSQNFDPTFQFFYTDISVISVTFGNSETCHLLCQWLRVSTNLALSCSRIWRFPKIWCFPLSAWQPRLPCSPLAPRKTRSHRWRIAVFRNTALKKACKPKDMLAGNWNTRAVVKWSFFQMKESLSLPSHEDTMTGYRSIQHYESKTHQHITIRGKGVLFKNVLDVSSQHFNLKSSHYPLPTGYFSKRILSQRKGIFYILSFNFIKYFVKVFGWLGEKLSILNKSTRFRSKRRLSKGWPLK